MDIIEVQISRREKHEGWSYEKPKGEERIAGECFIWSKELSTRESKEQERGIVITYTHNTEDQHYENEGEIPTISVMPNMAVMFKVEEDIVEYDPREPVDALSESLDIRGQKLWNRWSGKC